MREGMSARMFEVETPESRGAVSGRAITEALKKQGLTFSGKREVLSSGFLGPIYLLKAVDANGDTHRIVEKSFAINRMKDPTRSMMYETSVGSFDEAASDIRPRLALVDAETGGLKRVAVDWIYNEERALKGLEGIAGIPKLYTAVYEGKRGSVLEQFVDGFDLSQFEEMDLSDEDVEKIFDAYEETYKQAAQRGFVFNNPGSATVMVDAKSGQPFLMDWYNHAAGSIEQSGAVKEKYEQGLREIQARKQEVLDERTRVRNERSASNSEAA